MNISKGSMLYVERSNRYHFGIYIGNGVVVHFSNTDPDSMNIFTPVIHEVCLAEFLGENNKEITDLIHCATDKFFYAIEWSETNDVIKYSMAETVQRAKRCIGCSCFNKDKNMYETGGNGYSWKSNNCEHFAFWCMTGMHISKQVSTIEKLIKIIVSYEDYGAFIDLINDNSRERANKVLDRKKLLRYSEITEHRKDFRRLTPENVEYVKSVNQRPKSNNDFFQNSDKTFICNKAGENSFATSKAGIAVGDNMVINGLKSLSSIIKFNDGGCVYGIRLIRNPSFFSLWQYEYEIEVDAEGPRGFGSGRGYLRFTDMTGDTYSLSIESSTRKKHVVDYRSEQPYIVKVEWSNTSFN